MKEYVWRFKNQNVSTQLLVIMLTLTFVAALFTTGNDSMKKLTGAFGIFAGILLTWRSRALGYVLLGWSLCLLLLV